MRDRQHLSVRGCIALLAVLLAAVPGRAVDSLPGKPIDEILPEWRRSVASRISAGERELYASLHSDLEREAFVRAFWLARGHDPGRLQPSALWRWRQDYDFSGQFRGPDERSRVSWALGKPSDRREVQGCEAFLRRLELWRWNNVDGSVIFYLERALDPRSFRAWDPAQGTSVLLRQLDGPDLSPEELIENLSGNDCLVRWPDWQDDLLEALRGARAVADRQGHENNVEAGWTDDFRRRLAEEPPDRWLGGTSLDITPLGSHHRHTLIAGTLRIPAELLARNSAGRIFDTVRIRGEIQQRSRSDRFQVEHHIAGDLAADRPLELRFYRRLWPGSYRLLLRVEDGLGLPLLRTEQALEVPRSALGAPAPANTTRSWGELTRPEVVLFTTLPSVAIRVQDPEAAAGRLEVAVTTAGGPFARVDVLDGDRVVGRDEEPPFVFEVDLGSNLVAHRLTAIGYAPGEVELARDELVTSPPTPGFAVALDSQPEDGSLRAEAAVQTPLGEVVEQVELFLDETSRGRLLQPPFVWSLPVPSGGRPHVLRVRATLASGSWVEDARLLTPQLGEEVDVDLVELFVTPLDRNGRLLQGLEMGDFEIREDGELQTLQRLDRVAALPLNVALLLDTSSSMRRAVQTAGGSARRFFSHLLNADDRASLLTFDNEIHHQVPFVADADVLAYASLGLRSDGGTRLYDSIVYASRSFGDSNSKRALVVVTDGNDVGSDFPLEQTLTTVLESGVSLYSITLGGGRQPVDHSDLERLARLSGGQAFSAGKAEDLDRIFAQVEEELRSQYLLVYRPPARDDLDFRRVEIRVLRDGARVRSAQGYFPR